MTLDNLEAREMLKFSPPLNPLNLPNFPADPIPKVAPTPSKVG